MSPPIKTIFHSGKACLLHYRETSSKTDWTRCYSWYTLYCVVWHCWFRIALRVFLSFLISFHHDLILHFLFHSSIYVVNNKIILCIMNYLLKGWTWGYLKSNSIKYVREESFTCSGWSMGLWTHSVSSLLFILHYIMVYSNGMLRFRQLWFLFSNYRWVTCMVRIS